MSGNCMHVGEDMQDIANQECMEEDKSLSQVFLQHIYDLMRHTYFDALTDPVPTSYILTSTGAVIMWLMLWW